MDKANGNQVLQEANTTVTKDNGKVIKNMGEESLYGKVEMFIVENIGKMKEVDKGP